MMEYIGAKIESFHASHSVLVFLRLIVAPFQDV